jgi:hypothetical protein
LSRGRRLGLIALAVVIAAVAFAVDRPGDDDDSRPSGATADEKRPPRPSYERIRVSGGKPAGGLKDVTVKQGDTVRLAVTSDTADEVHVHGYDLLKDVPAGGTVRFRFHADVEGVFEVELEGAHVQVGKLTVEP